MSLTLRLAVVVGAAFAAAISVPAAGIRVTFADRVSAQAAIEEVYWRHRIWPKENPSPKPSLDAVIPRQALEARVENYLKESSALAELWHRPITREQLQAELDRMARDSHDPRLLQELFDALGNDADLIGETLARQTLADRLVRGWSSGENSGSFDTWWGERRARLPVDLEEQAQGLQLPSLQASACASDTWRPTHTELPDGRMDAYTVWTGTEMIVWGGRCEIGPGLTTGGRYNPATDTWLSTPGGATAPPTLGDASVVWTGTEMILWGGDSISAAEYRNSGYRYSPTTDTWMPTSIAGNVPVGRRLHTAVWTGTQMIVWGGQTANPSDSSRADRYDPVSDTWAPPSASVNAPSPRILHTAVWTGSEMIVWGGSTNTGGRYNPVSDTWTPTTLANAPTARREHTAVWTGSEMIVWGGRADVMSLYVNSGGRYNPATDTWQPTSQGPGDPSPQGGSATIWTGSKMIVYGGEAPDTSPHAYDPSSNSWQVGASSLLEKRYRSSVVWSGTEMIVWAGGINGERPYHTGARYNPATDKWVATSVGGVPAEREAAAGVWTGAEMIAWGGRVTRSDTGPSVNSGGRYYPATDSWTPTSLSGAPEARQRHGGVWTGTEMIVWAGRGSAPLNSGGRYDPMTDTWRPTSVGASVPPARNHAVVVWSGKEMIVAGDGQAAGGRYDPLLDRWTRTAVGPGIGSDGTVAVWSGSEMIVYQGPSGALSGRYNPTTDSWTLIPPAPLSGRFYPSAIWTGAEMIVWGGNSPATNTGARYNPVTNAWTPTSTGANVPAARGQHSAVWTGSEMLVWGGSSGSAPNTVTRGGRYDPLTDTWQLMSLGPDQPSQRTDHLAVWSGTQMIVWSGNPTTATGGLYCACPDGRLAYRDADGDGFGDAAVSVESCSGAVPAGYSADPQDCNDASAAIHPGAVETCNAFDDDCDGLVDEGSSVEDSDGDSVHDLCDDCVSTFDPAQSDTDHDGEGDACDVNDGEIYVYGPSDNSHIEWQQESGPTSWNVYNGDLQVLRNTGSYTQAPGSNPLADRICGVDGVSLSDPDPLPDGAGRFTLVTGVTNGVEGDLGTNSAGTPRPNTNPCP